MRIKEELEQRGIEKDYFERFYYALRDEKTLPSEEDFPPEQYSALKAYFEDIEILRPNGEIDEEKFKPFRIKKTLEFRFEIFEDDDGYEDPHGGAMPCRDFDDDDDFNGRKGGFSPCRRRY
jgi:hypothetical protein